MTQVATKLPEPPVFDGDPFTTDTLRDPRAVQDAMRELAPVVWLSKYETYAVARHEEVRTVLTDYTRFTAQGGVGMSDIRKPGAWRTASPITEVDPPRHTDVRRALNKVLSPAVVRTWRDTFHAEAEALAGRIAATGELDGVRDIVEAYVLKVFPDVLGVAMPRNAFLVIGEMNFNQLGPNNELTKASVSDAGPILQNYEAYFARESMLPGGFGEKIYAAEDAGDFARGTAGVQVRSFLRAGVDTTIAGIGHALNYLARNPDQWAKMKADPKLAKGAFEEAIRLESPAQLMHRTTVAEVELSGLLLRGDTKVGCYIGAANRDPRKFPDPDRFDIERVSAGEHVALGAGPHMCIGQNIARLEGESLLAALAARIDRIEPAGEPTYKTINTLRTLETLPLRLVVN